MSVSVSLSLSVSVSISVGVSECTEWRTLAVAVSAASPADAVFPDAAPGPADVLFVHKGGNGVEVGSCMSEV